jgi:hypothetical protein
MLRPLHEETKQEYEVDNTTLDYNIKTARLQR